MTKGYLFAFLLFFLLPINSFSQSQIQNPSIVVNGILNPLIDANSFLKDIAKSHAQRENKLLTEDEFIQMAKDPKTIVLDARSSNRYYQMHIVGAKSLPFTEFTEDSLKALIPSKDTRILIYCNNNIKNNTPETREAFASKSPPASLNLSTYTSLHTYGYTNVFELEPLIDPKLTKIKFEGFLVKNGDV